MSGTAESQGEGRVIAPPADASPASDAQRAAGARVPDFFIIGHEKCGTTALYKMLRKHPQVFMPDYKEPRFFSPDLRDARAIGRGERPDTLERYLALFAPAKAEQRAGEASPQYIRSPGAAARIAELQPEARIIAILREPVSFLRSFHTQALSSNLEVERDLRRALELEPSRRAGREVPHGTHPSWLMYSEHVRYVTQLRRFHEHFPPEHVKVLIYDDYRSDNQATLREVMRFLGVDDTIAIAPIETKREPRTAVRFMALHRFSRRLRMARHRPQNADPVTRLLSRLAPAGVPRTWRRFVYKAPPELDDGLTDELRHRFKPEVEALSEYLGRDLVALWGYEGV